MLPTTNQAFVFLSTVYTGFAIGLIYDLYRMIRYIKRFGNIITGLMDLLFWIGVSAISFIVIFEVNDGEVRFYTIAGLAIGWALYALILSPYVMKILLFICNMIAKLIKFIVKIVTWPFRRLARVFTGFFKVLVKPFSLIKKSIVKRRTSKE